MNRITDFYPPKYWMSTFDDVAQINAYTFLLNNYKESDVVAKIFKNDKKIKFLTKKDIENSVKSLSHKILSLLANENRQQLKIFGIIGASEESFILMLTSAFLSAHHSICFEELSASAIIDRAEIFEPDIIFFNKNSETKVKNLNLDNISKNIILYCLDIDNLNEEIKASNNDNFLDALEPKLYKSSDSFFTLYTSGSTGKPKAIVHSVNRYLKFSKFTAEYFFNLNKNSTIFTATDVGWINGHTYAVYGPLSCSAVTIIFENLPSLSDPNLISKIINSHGITCLYLSVTLLRILRSNSRHFDLEENQYPTLERIGSCGEPLANEVGKWALSFFKPKRKTIVNTFFQTETGGILIAPRDEDGLPKDFSSIGKPRKELGVCIAKDELSDDILKKENIEPNEILVKNPWAGIFQKVLSDRPLDYFTSHGYFRFHDVGFYDDQGFLYVGGRSDDVINSAGHRISSSEIESVCLTLKEIREACVVSISDYLIGEKPILFISTNNEISLNESELKNLLFELIEKKLTKYHQPYEINIFQNIPKTKSGKIMRRLMRGLVQDLIIDESKDYSTIANLDDFNKSRLNYLYEKINYYCNKNNIYLDLNEFAKKCGVRFDICEILSSLVIYFYEEILRISSAGNVSEINFTNNDFDINYSYKIFDEDNLINLNNVFLNFLKISKENSSKFKSFIISYVLEDKNYIRIFLQKNKANNYNLNIICQSNTSEQSISIRNKIIDKVLNNLHPPGNTINNKNSNIGIKKINLKCTGCKASLSELKRVRGDEAYLCNVINTEGQNIYICDLCLQGY